MSIGYSPESPYATSLQNAGWVEYWTCCICLEDLGAIGDGDHTCPNCGGVIRCSTQMEPVKRTAMIDENGDEVG